jgi:hypothetical protein
LFSFKRHRNQEYYFYLCSLIHVEECALFFRRNGYFIWLHGEVFVGSSCCISFMEDPEIYQKVPTLEENNITSFCDRTPSSYMGITSSGNVVNYTMFLLVMYTFICVFGGINVFYDFDIWFCVFHFIPKYNRHFIINLYYRRRFQERW